MESPRQPKSLEKQMLQIHFNGVTKEVPALHKNWVCRERSFVCYTRHPTLDESGQFMMGAKETWLQLVEFIQQDLKWLLMRPYHKFWSQVIYSEGPMLMLTSFLQEAPPIYEQHLLPDDSEVRAALSETERLVFLVFLRLSKESESINNFISKEKLAELWYENYIFTVPVLFDICLIYGLSNPQLTSDLLRHVLTIQPAYVHDFQETVEYLFQACDTLKESFFLEKLDDHPTKFDQKKPLSSSDVRDLVLHLYDMVKTVQIFLDVYPPGGKYLTSLAPKLAEFYTSVIPVITKTVNRLDDDELRKWRIPDMVTESRLEIIGIVRHIVSFLLNDVMEEASKKQEKVDGCLDFICQLLSEPVFVSDYSQFHSFHVDVDLLTQLEPEVDSVKVSYILESLASCMDVPPPAQRAPPQRNFVNYPSSSSGAAAKPLSTVVSGIELQSLVTQVQDILPHLGAGFIEACLKHYEYDTERVIAAVLESSLPPNLEESNWDDQQHTRVTETERKNVFDHDEFDVMSRDHVDTSRIHKGKRKSKHKNLNELLEDKTELAGFRDRYTALGVVEDETYDDEYDDTYEALDVSVREADEEKERRPFVVPRVLRVKEVVEEEDDEDVMEEHRPSVSKDYFVQNPAELRARAEQKRQEKQHQKNRDVVGKPKGQGQDKDVTNNRNFKSTHKSSSGNHNRRNQASRKRNQGMIPS